MDNCTDLACIVNTPEPVLLCFRWFPSLGTDITRHLILSVCGDQLIRDIGQTQRFPHFWGPGLRLWHCQMADWTAELLWWLLIYTGTQSSLSWLWLQMFETFFFWLEISISFHKLQAPQRKCNICTKALVMFSFTYNPIPCRQKTQLQCSFQPLDGTIASISYF